MNYNIKIKVSSRTVAEEILSVIIKHFPDGEWEIDEPDAIAGAWAVRGENPDDIHDAMHLYFTTESEAKRLVQIMQTNDEGFCDYNWSVTGQTASFPSSDLYSTAEDGIEDFDLFMDEDLYPLKRGV